MSKKKQKLCKMYKENPEGTLAIFAAIFVLISAMIEPVFSAGLAFGLIIAFAIYQFAFAKEKK